jgi:hypothetical protein
MASYLELAKRRRLLFETKDEPRRKAAEELGAAFFSFDLAITDPSATTEAIVDDRDIAGRI